MAKNLTLGTGISPVRETTAFPNPKLAILGGPPAFAEPVYVGRPNIGSRRALMKRIEDVLDRKWLTNRGPYVLELERRLCELTGARHATAMCNATVALEVAIRALELTGEVIVPSFTFVASAHALYWLGLKPVFCDIDPRTHCIDPTKVEHAITPRTTGIIGVHLWGRPCPVDDLQEIATRHKLKLVFDAAHALGCSTGGKMIGSFGDCEVFSFHATKFVNSFEGGAVVTNDDRLAEKIGLMHNAGFVGYDQVVCEGTNAKMNEVSAAMALTSLESIAEFVTVNRAHYQRYRLELAGIPGLRVVEYDTAERCNYQYMVLEIDEKRTGLDRDTLMEVLHAENIIARRYFYPGCHRMQPYSTIDPGAGSQLPHTEKLSDCVLCLPTGTGVTDEDIILICEIVREAIRHAESVKQTVSAAEGTAGS